MRFILAAALAASFAGAAWAAQPAKSLDAKPVAITEMASKDVVSARCWICQPSDVK
jgi:hypothetical protein